MHGRSVGVWLERRVWSDRTSEFGRNVRVWSEHRSIGTVGEYIFIDRCSVGTKDSV